jgi:hypothetical protein
MFSPEPLFESRYVVRKIQGSVAIHFISTLTASQRTWHALWLESIPALPDFSLKLLFPDHISSVSFRHPSSLPQFSVRGKCSLSPSPDGSYSTSTSEHADAPAGIEHRDFRPAENDDSLAQNGHD